MSEISTTATTSSDAFYIKQSCFLSVKYHFSCWLSMLNSEDVEKCNRCKLACACAFVSMNVQSCAPHSQKHRLISFSLAEWKGPSAEWICMHYVVEKNRAGMSKTLFSWAKHFILGADSCSFGLFLIFDPVKILAWTLWWCKALISWHLSLTSRLWRVFLCSQPDYNFSSYRKRHVEAKVRDGDLDSSCIMLLHNDLLTRNIMVSIMCLYSLKMGLQRQLW